MSNLFMIYQINTDNNGTFFKTMIQYGVIMILMNI
jgi:hypothetical protein